jgi:hypothetical protein
MPGRHGRPLSKIKEGDEPQPVLRGMVLLDDEGFYPGDSVAFSRDRIRVLPGTLKLWDASTGQLICTSRSTSGANLGHAFELT